MAKGPRDRPKGKEDRAEVVEKRVWGRQMVKSSGRLKKKNEGKLAEK